MQLVTQAMMTQQGACLCHQNRFDYFIPSYLTYSVSIPLRFLTLSHKIRNKMEKSDYTYMLITTT